VSDVTDPGAEPTSRRDPRELARLVAAGVVIVAFLVLAAIAIAASRSDFSLSAPAGASEPVQQPAAALPITPEVTQLRAAAPLVVAAPVAVAPAPVPVATTVPAPAPLDPPPALPEETGKPCQAFNLPAPQQVGGLQSLIRLVPLFGPFSAEAFAMMPAFEPGFDVLGPLFPLFELGLDGAAPVLDAITPPAQQVTQTLFDLVAPGYEPVRPQVLSAEAQLAAFLQPIVQQLADTPGSECLIALEGVLASLVL
jgi:hypothetical protein